MELDQVIDKRILGSECTNNELNVMNVELSQLSIIDLILEV